jgi:ubiquinone/menaquinone biosynthesis C-methylase UbiE
MLDQAHRRNQSAVESGRVTLERSTADSIPWPDGNFSGAVAVNCVQLWDPIDASVREVARVLAPAGRFVSTTHVWAIEKRSPLQQWVSATSELLSGAGFDQIAHRIVSFRSGKGLVLRAEKLQLCNRKAP